MTENIINKQLKNIAFTLAETLLVMGIIGVVATLTIPNLNQSTANREAVARVKKAYANLNDAYGRAVAKYGPVMTWATGSEENAAVIFGRRVSEFMKVSKTCQAGDSSCLQQIKFDFNNKYQLAYNLGYTVVLNDGITINFNGASLYNSDLCDKAQSETRTDVCGDPILITDTISQILVDIDGKNKGSGTLGIDVFPFILAKSGIYPAFDGDRDFLYEDYGYDACFTDGVCTGWVIKNGNMDYLKCPDDLSWENPTCK